MPNVLRPLVESPYESLVAIGWIFLATATVYSKVCLSYQLTLRGMFIDGFPAAALSLYIMLASFRLVQFRSFSPRTVIYQIPK